MLKQRKNLVLLSTVSSRHFVYRIGYTSVNFQKKWQDAFFIKTRLRLGESSTKRWENIQLDQSLRVEQKILKAFRVTEATTNANILAGASRSEVCTTLMSSSTVAFAFSDTVFEQTDYLRVAMQSSRAYTNCYQSDSRSNFTASKAPCCLGKHLN